MKDRLAQVIYWIGCVGGLFFVGWLLLFIVMVTQDDRAVDWVANIVLLLSLSLGSYGAGWAVRYVISGQK